MNLPFMVINMMKTGTSFYLILIEMLLKGH